MSTAELEGLRARLATVEHMLEEVAALHRDSKILMFEVDEVTRDGAGRIQAIAGTNTEWVHDTGAVFHRWDQHPYIIGEV